MRDPRTGGGTPSAVSTTKRVDVRRIRLGGTIVARRTIPDRSASMTRIGTRQPKVWIDPVAMATDPERAPRSPRRRSACDVATPTSLSTVSPIMSCTLRYGPLVGTLAPLWQRQNDASCAPAARRRTTAASPTLAAAEPRRHFLRRSRGPMRGFYRAGTAVFKVPDRGPRSCTQTSEPELGAQVLAG